MLNGVIVMNKEEITLNKEKYFNLHITEEDIQNSINGMSILDDYMGQIHKSIEEMKNKYFVENLEVVINENLIYVFDIKKRKNTIFGCKISFESLPEDISFIVREDYKPSYEVLENRIDKAIEYIEKHHYRWYDLNGEEYIEPTEFDNNVNPKVLLEILKGEK